MSFVLTKKDVIALNQEFSNGNMHNETSLEFALSSAKRTENWIKAMALVVRAILLDHVFSEGNKRTAALLIKCYSNYGGYETYDDKIIKLTKEIILKRITSIKRIEDMLEDAIK